MIRKNRTKSGKRRYSPRVHVGGGRYQMLGTFDTEREAKEAEAKWSLKQGGRSNQRGGQFADFYLAGYAARVKASTLQTGTTAINRWREQFETRRLSTIDATEAEQWARENGWTFEAADLADPHPRVSGPAHRRSGRGAGDDRRAAPRPRRVRPLHRLSGDPAPSWKGP